MTTLLAIRVEPRDNVQEYDAPFLFQVACDANHRPLKQAALGIWGMLEDSDDRQPFILLADGRMDFGSEFTEDPDRYFQTDLLAQKIQVGATVAITAPDRDRTGVEHRLTCEITKVVPLG